MGQGAGNRQPVTGVASLDASRGPVLTSTISGLAQSTVPSQPPPHLSIGHLDAVSVQAALGLRRDLRNLIVNAATHGKACRIDLAVAGSRAVLTICYHGLGIPPELLNKAFKPFFHVDPGRLQSIPGAGPGLAIVKESSSATAAP